MADLYDLYRGNEPFAGETGDYVALRIVAQDQEQEINRLRTELAVARERAAWQPIETAPKDGTEVLLAVTMRAGIPGKMLVGHYMRGGYCIEDHPAIDAGWYFWNGCMFDRASKPTHWMPLPAAPTSAAHTGAAEED